MVSEPILITAPASLPVTLAAVKQYLRIDDAYLDAELEKQIAAAVDDIQLMTGTRIAPQIVELVASRFEELAHFDVGPVTDVVEIRYLATDGSVATLPIGAVRLTGAGLSRGLAPSFGRSWPVTATAADAIAVQLQVGYPVGKLPGQVELAILEYVRALSDGVAPAVERFLVNSRI